MNCYHCNAPVPADGLFCPACGRNQGFDRATIRAAARGDQAALTELYEKTYPSVYHTIKFMVRDEDATLDILQDSYLKAFRSLDQLQDPARFRAWIKRIAHNRAIDYLRKAQPVSFSSLEPEDADGPVDFADDRPESIPEVAIDQQETTRLLNEILDSLPEEQRVCVTLFYYDQLSVREIAEELGVSENTVKSRLNYGRKKIEAQVRELERRGTRLFGLAPIALLMALFHAQEAQAAELGAASVLGSVLAEMGGAAGTAATGGAAAGTTAPNAGASAAGVARHAASVAGTAASQAAHAAGWSVGTKIAAALVAGALVGGGATVALQSRHQEPQADVAQEAIEAGTEAESSLPDAELPIEEGTASDAERAVPESPSTPSPADTVAATPQDDVIVAYQEVVHAYADAMNDDPATNPLYQTYPLVRTWVDSRGETVAVEHLLIDLNSDGVPELIMGAFDVTWHNEGWDVWYPFEVYTYDGKNVLAQFVGSYGGSADWIHIATDGTLWLTRGNADPTPITCWRLPYGETFLVEVADTGTLTDAEGLEWKSVLRTVG